MNQRTYLYQIQIIDLDLAKHHKRIEEINSYLSYNADEKKIELEVSTYEADRKNKQLNLKRISDEASLLQNKITRSEQSLYDGTIKNPKELQDVNSEIASNKKRLLTLDEKQLEIMFEIEELDNTIFGFNKSLEDLRADKNKKSEEYLLEKDNLENEINKLKVGKDTLVNQVSDEVYSIYEKLRKTKNNIAVSIVVDNCCSICGNSLTPMDIQIAKSASDDVFCPVCKRFLFVG